MRLKPKDPGCPASSTAAIDPTIDLQALLCRLELVPIRPKLLPHQLELLVPHTLNVSLLSQHVQRFPGVQFRILHISQDVKDPCHVLVLLAVKRKQLFSRQQVDDLPSQPQRLVWLVGLKSEDSIFPQLLDLATSSIRCRNFSRPGRAKIARAFKTPSLEPLLPLLGRLSERNVYGKKIVSQLLSPLTYSQPDETHN